MPDSFNEGESQDKAKSVDPVKPEEEHPKEMAASTREKGKNAEKPMSVSKKKCFRAFIENVGYDTCSEAQDSCACHPKRGGGA